MNKLLLPLAAAFALASCSPPPYPKQYKDLERHWVTVNLQGGGQVAGILWPDGSVGGKEPGTVDGAFHPSTRINWDKVLTVRRGR